MKFKIQLQLVSILILGVSLQGKETSSNKTITFSEHIAPIVFSNCSSCHRPNEAAPFSLLNYRDVQKRGELIIDVVEDRYMPPWHAQSKDFEFQDHRGLNENEISLMLDWVESGMAEGDPSKLPALPKFTEGWQLGVPDLVVSMEKGYTLYADGPDIYRNFVIPLNLDEDKWIQAIEFRPGKRSVVHHSLFYYDTSGQAREQDAADPIPGYKSMGGAQREGSSIGGWAVGGIPKNMPDGLAHFLPKESDLILSTHFHPSGKKETEVSTIGFYFSNEPPKERFTAIQLPPVFGALSGVNIPAGESNYSKTDSFVLPVDVKAFGISSHAHYLGKRMKMTATLPNNEVKELLLITNWDFSWQEQYRFKDFVYLPAGSRLDGEVVWDNSKDNVNNPNDPPVTVRWGRESSDEMGSVTLQMVAADKSEFGKLNQAIRKHTTDSRQNMRSGQFAGRGGNNREGLLKRMIERFDKDGDGVLSPSEREQAQAAFGK
jgi:hypothetical protein